MLQDEVHCVTLYFAGKHPKVIISTPIKNREYVKEYTISHRLKFIKPKGILPYDSWNFEKVIRSIRIIKV